MGQTEAMGESYSGGDEQSRRSSEEELEQLLQTPELEPFEIEEESQTFYKATGKGAKNSPIRRCISFLHGPQPPRVQTIQPILPAVQSLPISLLDRWAPTKLRKTVLLIGYLLIWLAAFSGPLIKGKGTVLDAWGHSVRQLRCVDTLWQRNNECGLDGIDCRPFANQSFAFRCPANCAGVKLLNPHHVGLQEVNYQPLVVGGPIYRGDSFLCASAIHSGVVDDREGGCGVVTLRGDYYNFYPSSQNGIESISFDSYFPLTFSVAEDPRLHCHSKDPRAALLAVSVFFTVVLCVLTSSPSIIFFVTFTSVYLHVALVSDPLNVSGPSETVLPELFSWFMRTFLPAMFCGAVIYATVVRRTLQNLTAHFERAVLWLGALWFGALSNYTLDWLPLSRLTAHDLEQQPGAKLALGGVVTVIVLIVAQQIYYFWLEGRLLGYLRLYCLFLMAIAVGLLLPGLNLRIHHYILALLLLPGTSMQTRPALIYQGLLLGLFINGVARWGFASVLETAAALRGDAQTGSMLPDVVDPLIYLHEPVWNISFKWKASASAWQHDGVSVLVNDVERYRAFFAEEAIPDETFTWLRNATLNTPEYFRFAYLKDGRALDYTEAATWFVNGTWRKGAAYY